MYRPTSFGLVTPPLFLSLTHYLCPTIFRQLSPLYDFSMNRKDLMACLRRCRRALLSSLATLSAVFPTPEGATERFKFSNRSPPCTKSTPPRPHPWPFPVKPLPVLFPLLETLPRGPQSTSAFTRPPQFLQRTTLSQFFFLNRLFHPPSSSTGLTSVPCPLKPLTGFQPLPVCRLHPVR